MPSSPTPFTLNDLPSFSAWPARLLGLEPCQQRTKTLEEIDREYEHEKWGPLLRVVDQQNDPATVERLDSLFQDMDSPRPCYQDGKFLSYPGYAAAREAFLDCMQKHLGPYLPAKSIVELGAGYGAIFLHLASRGFYKTAELFACEYSHSGRELLRKGSSAHDLDINVLACDFTNNPIIKGQIPKNSLIYTSFATCTIPELGNDFIEKLLDLNPKAVLHFEPIFEHTSSQTLIDLLQRRYIEINDYNKNLLTLIRDSETKGYIRIKSETPDVFGFHPLCAASFVAWEPRQK